jgi:hypothetical protein
MLEVGLGHNNGQDSIFGNIKVNQAFAGIYAIKSTT